MKTYCRILSWFIAALLVLGNRPLAAASTGAEQWADEYELKAAFVYNIARFVDWPQGALGERIVIGVADDEPMTAVMRKFFSDKRIGTREIEVRAVHSPGEFRACNILLFSYPDRSRMRDALKEVQRVSTLTIGEGAEFAQNGGIVALVAHDSTYRLAINRQAAERARLNISSKLMSLATLVLEEETDAGGKK